MRWLITCSLLLVACSSPPAPSSTAEDTPSEPSPSPPDTSAPPVSTTTTTLPPPATPPAKKVMLYMQPPVTSIVRPLLAHWPPSGQTFDPWARLATGEIGCVAIAGDGTKALLIVGNVSAYDQLQHPWETRVIVAAADASQTRSFELADHCEPGSGDRCKLANAAAALVASGDVQALLGGTSLGMCERGADLWPNPTAEIWPYGQRVTVSVVDEGLAIASADAKVLVAEPSDRDMRLAGRSIWFSRSAGAVLIESAIIPVEGGASVTDIEATLIPPRRLNIHPCVPLPAVSSPDAVVLAAFDGVVVDGCLAMTRNLRSAAIVLGRSGTDSGRRVAWFGPGAKPSGVCTQGVTRECEQSFDCFIDDDCPAAERAALRDAALAEGMLRCPPAPDHLEFRGAPYTASVNGRTLMLRGATGPARHAVEVLDADDGKTMRASVAGYVQAQGGVGFVRVRRESRSGDSSPFDDVAILDPSTEPFCPPGYTYDDTPHVLVPASATAGDLRVTASSVAANVPGYTFGAANLIDTQLDTSWQPKTAADAWVELAFDSERDVTALEIANGFQRIDEQGDLFVGNARVLTATIACAGREPFSANLDPDARGFQTISFVEVCHTRTVRVTIQTWAPGARWKNDLALSEIRPVVKPP